MAHKSFEGISKFKYSVTKSGLLFKPEIMTRTMRNEKQCISDELMLMLENKLHLAQSLKCVWDYKSKDLYMFNYSVMRKISS